MIPALFALLVALAPLAAQTFPPAFPRDGAKKLIDNERVTVWDVTLEKGKVAELHRHMHDTVVVELAEVTIRDAGPDRIAHNGVRHAGQVGFTAKGSVDMQGTTSDTSRHTIFIELKDVTVPPLRNTTGLPEAFPRSGSKTLVNNPRVSVYDFSWTPGKPTEMHFHRKDVVVIYLGNGALSSTTQDGQTTVSPHAPGEVRFNARNRAHTELLTTGSQRVIAVELK